MLIDTESLASGLRKFDLVFLMGEIDLDSELARLTADISIRGKADGEPGRIDVSGNFETSVEADCSRCLEPVALPMDIEFQAMYVKPSAFSAAGENQLVGDDMSVDVLENESVDLKDIIREQILLNLPKQVFCKNDCLGLCEKCGANRNLIDCNCINDEIDPRWAALADFN